LSDSQLALSSTFANADRIPLRPIPWLFIVPGLALTLLAGRARDVGAWRRRHGAAPGHRSLRQLTKPLKEIHMGANAQVVKNAYAAFGRGDIAAVHAFTVRNGKITKFRECVDADAALS
jgi:hypothetical protein